MGVVVRRSPLPDCIFRIAIVVRLWVWNTPSLTIDEGESLVEIWAVLQNLKERSPIHINKLKLNNILKKKLIKF